MLRPGHLATQASLLTVALLLAGAPALASAQAPSADPPTSCSAYASTPLPAEAATIPTPKTFPACASYRSYRGIGRKVDYAEARACAWQERSAQRANLQQNPKEPTAWVVGGSLILADIYFNGAGVKPNVPLALRFACESEKGMAELALPHVKDSPGTHKPFEFCDYAATTLTMNFCEGYETEIEDDHRDRTYKDIESSMSPDQKAAFEKLLTAQHAYVVAHASEVDQGGTIRAIRTMGSQNILNDIFHTNLVHFERKQWPALSADQIKNADEALQRQYKRTVQKLSTQSQDQIDGGAVTAGHLATVERAWEAYREAWVAFARVRYPTAVDAIGAEITLERYRFLQTV